MKQSENYPLLSNINNPADLSALDRHQLEAVATELRGFLTHCVSQSGGHFSAGLSYLPWTGPDW